MRVQIQGWVDSTFDGGSPVAAIISLSCGAILHLGICRYAGKGQGEVSLLRQLWNILCPGDVLLTDCLMSNWAGITLLQQRGFETVSRLNKAVRSADFRRGKRLGKDDHLVRWKKPTSIRSVDRPTYKSLTEFLTIREARIRVEQPGFRTKFIVVVTTLLDPEQTTTEDLALLYRERWNNELDLRSIKITLQMDKWIDWKWQAMDGAMSKAPLGGEKNRAEPDRPGQAGYQAVGFDGRQRHPLSSRRRRCEHA